MCCTCTLYTSKMYATWIVMCKHWPRHSREQCQGAEHCALPPRGFFSVLTIFNKGCLIWTISSLPSSENQLMYHENRKSSQNLECANRQIASSSAPFATLHYSEFILIVWSTDKHSLHYWYSHQFWIPFTTGIHSTARSFSIDWSDDGPIRSGERPAARCEVGRG